MIRRWWVPLAAAVILLIGLALWAGPNAVWGPRLWLAGLVGLGLPLVWRTLRGALAGRFAADLVASLAIIGAIALDQPLAGLIVVLMQTGGEALEQYAAGRASRAVAKLEAEAPRRATRFEDGALQDITVDAIRIGNRLLVRPGEMIACDAIVVAGFSHVDGSRLTGEPIPVTATPGTRLMSGSLNLEAPLTVEATALAEESQYARIVQLVRTARDSKAPLQRLADRYAVVFTPITLAVCGAAWLTSQDPLRVLAVLVVATPCPLILAVPVAMIGGLSRAARRGIIMRSGDALERLGEVTVALLDKTGTLTIGRPVVRSVSAIPPNTENEVLAAAAAVEAGSGHMLARSVVEAAEARGLELTAAIGVTESPGRGVVGRVGRREVAIGSAKYVMNLYPGLQDASYAAPGLTACVALDGQAAGTVEFADQLRPEAIDLIGGLRRLGLHRIIMVTGDQHAHAATMSAAAGLTEYRAELLPAEKMEAVAELEAQGEKVLMVGDGTNDAPALTRASVGVALAAHGGGVTAEAADTVILADNPGLVVEAVAISRRTMQIARQSVWVGLGLSAAAMVVAAFGYVPPTIGAVLQEVIDVAVILNALRASSGNGPDGGQAVKAVSDGFQGPFIRGG